MNSTNAGGRTLHWRAWCRIACGFALALCLFPAYALGLGQIQVKSRPGQPLLAEIPIISSDPTELQGLQAQLASPETFQRIGLQAPQGIVSDLRFTLAVDDAGRPILRVTTLAPVDQPLVTFLVEVDWGQGRLVREYSALVETPTAVSAAAEPPIDAPTVAPPNTIERVPDAELATQPEPQPEPAPQTAAQPEPPSTPAPGAQPPAPPAPVLATQPQPAPGTDYGPVKRGETLSNIAGAMGQGSGYSLDQTMLAVLRANPDAFIGDDINRLKQGAVLRMPGQDELARYDAAQASAMVREQVARWRDARRAQVQPASSATAGDGQAAAADASRRVSQARLEIAPPSASAAQRAGTRSGISAGGEGEMLRQELQQTQETLAARDQEVVELKARVAELEKLQQQQQQLIAMKDSDLASAQQALAKSNQAATTQPAAAPAAATPASSAMPAWWWAVPLLLALALGGWWWSRRRAQRAPRKVFDAEALASAVPVVADAPRAEAPAPTPRPASATGPTWHTGGNGADRIAPLNPAPPGHERIELARAYIDLGDVQTARSLLQEVVASGDPDARGEAARVLQGLG